MLTKLKYLKSPNLPLIFNSFIFILILIIVSIYPNSFIFAIGLIIGTLVLLYISTNMGLFTDIDIPQEETRNNETLEHAVSEIHHLLEIAKESVIIVSGSLNEIIWGNSIILNDFESIKQKKINLQILCHKNVNIRRNSKLYKFLKNSIENNTVDLFLTNNRPEAHFIIVDDLHVRLEQKHDANAIEREALIKIFGAELANRAKIKYESYTIESIKIIKNNFEEIIFNKED